MLEWSGGPGRRYFELMLERELNPTMLLAATELPGAGPLTDDRPLTPDIERVAAMLAAEAIL